MGVPHRVGRDGAELPPGEVGTVSFEGGTRSDFSRVARGRSTTATRPRPPPRPTSAAGGPSATSGISQFGTAPGPSPDISGIKPV